MREQVRQQAKRLAVLEKRLAEATEFTDQQQQRFAATATAMAMGLSYGQTRELLGIVGKKNVPAVRRLAAG
jgi:hypothetical protein